MPPDLAAETTPDITARVCRAACRLCARLNWAPVTELRLPTGRRLDILALKPDGGLVAIEVKSGAPDFLSDSKWPEYRDWCDALYFAVDLDFPRELLPEDTGLIVADGLDAVMIRPAPAHPLAGARRKSLTHRFASLAAGRLAALMDPSGAAELRAALAVE
ncbi:MmcB family DNA repair protein [Acetobacteraceae bacterium H6797]|nr:MmcB family DNA repair protein [Acetobacteraceae bacterium H6797]